MIMYINLCSRTPSRDVRPGACFSDAYWKKAVSDININLFMHRI